jgi:hypothetical protein
MIKKLFLAIALLLLAVNTSLAQSNSAYTRFGIGDVEFSTSARKIGIGQLAVSVIDDNSISTLNPAAWYKFKGTRFSVDLSYTGLFISDNNSSSFYSETDFKGFSFGFPVSEDYGIGVATGLIPYSRVSYKAKEIVSGSESYTADYEGKGGLSQIFIGTSVLLPGEISIGATLDYYFGNLSYKTDINFVNQTTFPSQFEKLQKSTGFGSTVGILTPDLISVFGIGGVVSNLRLGASVKIIPEMDTDILLISRSVTIEDTLFNNRTTMIVPQRVSAGLSFNLFSNYLLTMDYAFQPWSEYKLANNTQNVLRDMHKISTGFEYKPGQILGASVWEQIIWRAGLSFEKTQYLINNQGIDQFSIFGGLSFPLGLENSIDIALQYSTRGTTDFGLLKEQIIKLNFGISFGEIWFLRYDY